MAKWSQHNFANLPSSSASSASPPSPTSVHQHMTSEGPKDTASQALLLQVSRLRRRRQRELLLQIDEDRRMQRTPVVTASSSDEEDIRNRQFIQTDRRNTFLCSSLSLSTLDLQKNATIAEEGEEDTEDSTDGGEGEDSRSLFSNEDSSFDSS